MSVYVNTCPQLMCYGVHCCIYTMVETSIFVEVDAMSVLQLLASLARRFAPLLDHCALPQILVSWALPMSHLSHMVSVLLPTMVPLHGIPCHLHTDINRSLIASSKLWKLICFLSVNVIILFSMLLRIVIYVFRSLFVWFMGHVGVCPTELS